MAAERGETRNKDANENRGDRNAGGKGGTGKENEPWLLGRRAAPLLRGIVFLRLPQSDRTSPPPMNVGLMKMKQHVVTPSQTWEARAFGFVETAVYHDVVALAEISSLRTTAVRGGGGRGGGGDCTSIIRPGLACIMIRLCFYCPVPVLGSGR